MRSSSHITPTGKIRGRRPAPATTGLTGRKIIVDKLRAAAARTAGGRVPPGKDPSKVDRSACYMGRYNRQEHRARRGWPATRRCSSLNAIGVANPVSITVSTENTAVDSRRPDCGIGEEHFPLTPPRGIIKATPETCCARSTSKTGPPRPLRPRAGAQWVSSRGKRLTRPMRWPRRPGPDGLLSVGAG